MVATVNKEFLVYLAVCYQKGDGVPNDMKEAVRYCQLAADQNFAQANEALKNPSIFASFVKSSSSKPMDEKTGALARHYPLFTRM